MPQNAAAAQRLLTRARRQRLDAEGVLPVASAGAIVEAAMPGAGWTAAMALQDPGLALTVAAAAAHSRVDRCEELAALAASVPLAGRPDALAAAERHLARIDPLWAWRLVEDLVGPDAAMEAALGFDIAAQAAARHLAWRPPSALPEAYARQLRADEVARAAVAGRIQRDDPALALLNDDPPGRLLHPSEAGVYLAAAAAVDVAWALDIALGLLHTHPPSHLLPAMRLAAESATAAGLGDRVVALAYASGFASEQATWAAAAAAGGGLSGRALTQLAADLAPRVTDELDPGRELVAGLPLLEALAHGGEADQLGALALDWRTPPPLLVQHLAMAETGRGASALRNHPRLKRLLEVPEDDWGGRAGPLPGWWLAAGPEPDDRLTACQDVLAVVAHPPWRPLPGSLADLVGNAEPRQQDFPG